MIPPASICFTKLLEGPHQLALNNNKYAFDGSLGFILLRGLIWLSGFSSDGGEEEACDVVKEAPTTVEKQIDEGVEKQIDDGVEKQIDEGAGEQIDEGAEKQIDGVEMKYRLKALMNVRVSPSLSSKKIATLLPGTIVTVAKISNDWLHLSNGSFIFFGNGKYAEKVQ